MTGIGIREHLILFTRYPEPGRVKTRLIPALGETGAASKHRDLTANTLTQADRLGEFRRVSLEIRYEGGDTTSMAAWLGLDRDYFDQASGSLGDRMNRAFQDAFSAGSDRVIIIGSDCPDLTAEILSNAFDSLNEADLILGPARDGGYYLIGLRAPAPELFRDIAWGSSQVLDQTLAIVRALGLTAGLLPELRDIDRPEDLSDQ